MLLREISHTLLIGLSYSCGVETAISARDKAVHQKLVIHLLLLCIFLLPLLFEYSIEVELLLVLSAIFLVHFAGN